jgi:hypothetical protein
MVAPVFRQPTMDRPIEDTEDLIDHLKPLLQKEFSRYVNEFYFGDIGIYLPSSFSGSRREPKAVLALSPAFDRLVPNSRTSLSEYREIGIDIIALVNITPYFSAKPEEAYGERALAALMRRVRKFLTQQELTTLDGRAVFFSVGDINWAWTGRDNDAIRAASLEVVAQVRVQRMGP